MLKQTPKTNNWTKEYFENFETEVKKVYALAEKAKATGLDPDDHLDIPLAMSMAEKVVGLISAVYPQMKGTDIAKRILELEKKYGKLDPAVSFQIAEEIAKQKFCEFSSLLEAIDAGIRVGFAYLTLGVVSSPIEGYTRLKLEKTKDGKDYFVVYFSGPIRSAGTTAGCMVLMLIDYLREKFGYAKYDPTEEEVKRYIMENTDYHERVTNLQYFPTPEEMEFLAKNIPIQIAGEPTEKLEVSNHKNLPRVDTDYIRGGMCLIFSEGLAQKAAKGFRLYKAIKEKGFELTGFDFLEKYLDLHKKRDAGKVKGPVRPTYINDLVAGRPVFGHPSRSGGFRFRYGRGRTSGFSAVSMHPATMAVTDDFIAIGTQLKIEKPTKGCVVTACDEIDGPIVKLVNGSVRKLKSRPEAEEVYSDVEEIIYLGDILFPFSDLANRNSELIKSGYVEEWWKLDLRKKAPEIEKNLDYLNVEFSEAVNLSKKYKIPLYPEFIFYWSQISKKQFLDLISWLEKSVFEDKIIFPYKKDEQEEFSEAKRALEVLGIEHKVTIENVVINKKNSLGLLANLGLGYFEDFINLKEGDKIFLKNYFNLEDFEKLFSDKDSDKNYEKPVLDVVNLVSKFIIKDKAGEFIGARMGRPEKAKPRKLVGSPNVLFPVAREGGRLRSLNAACEVGKVYAEFPIFYCEKCEKETIYSCCEKCGSLTRKMFYFPEEQEKTFSRQVDDKTGFGYERKNLDINYYFNKAVENLGLRRDELPPLIKGVRGTTSEDHVMENLAKGILRAKNNLQVNKDGTIRFDGTELPLIYFKPVEINTSVERLRELGYKKDIYGSELISDEQILELMPHDVLLPSSPDSLDERADDVFTRTCNFVDEELERFYKLPRFHNIKSKEDLVGQLGVFMAPHNCAGVVCRFIGFSNSLGIYASPYMHAAVRRDCFDYNTYFPVRENGFWKIVKIGELVERLNPDKIVDNYGTKEKKVENFEAIGFDDSVKNIKINNFTKHPKRRMLEIKTALGKKINVTENHKFFIKNRIKTASDLKIGDELPLPLKIEIPFRKLEKINLLESLENKKLMVRGIREIINSVDAGQKEKILSKMKISKKQFMNYKIRDSFPAEFVMSLDKKFKKEIFKKGKITIKRDNIEIPIIIKPDNDLLEVIGLYVAEGYSRTVSGKKGLSQVYIASNDFKIRGFIKKVIRKHFGLKPSENKKDRVTFSSKILYLFFTEILKCGKTVGEKRIPYLFLDAETEKLACILRGYFEGDGSVSKSDRRVTCDSVSEGLLYDLEFCLARFGIFSKKYEYEKKPGPKVSEFYTRNRKEIPVFKITKLIIGSDFVRKFKKIGFLSRRKKEILNFHLNKKSFSGMRIRKDENFVYDPVVSIKEAGERESYCLNVNTKKHLVLTNSIISKQCDGDEAAVMLLTDVLFNFSKKFLPSHRGGTQDAPLVLNAKIDAGEVDDQILDLELAWEYPIELYELAELKKHSSEIKNIRIVKDVLKENKNPFLDIGFTHNTFDFNDGVKCSNYKKLGAMSEKVQHQMELVEKIRAADTSDTARLIIEKHFMRDMRGNLRKFSMQGFRCVDCNSIFRRPPLNGICSVCKGKLIFTIHEGGIKKYLEPAIELTKKYNLSPYIRQTLELTKEVIDSIFGKELEKQEA
ncbi:DNA polymerase II large subunit, partial [Candidatus Pacearchaeota archaeon]|nr:DNA polymerase II large subunit [Candidatus Pacearchaeota archaeon]